MVFKYIALLSLLICISQIHSKKKKSANEGQALSGYFLQNRICRYFHSAPPRSKSCTPKKANIFRRDGKPNGRKTSLQEKKTTSISHRAPKSSPRNSLVPKTNRHKGVKHLVLSRNRQIKRKLYHKSKKQDMKKTTNVNIIEMMHGDQPVNSNIGKKTGKKISDRAKRLKELMKHRKKKQQKPQRKNLRTDKKANKAAVKPHSNYKLKDQRKLKKKGKKKKLQLFKSLNRTSSPMKNNTATPTLISNRALIYDSNSKPGTKYIFDHLTGSCETTSKRRIKLKNRRGKRMTLERRPFRSNNRRVFKNGRQRALKNLKMKTSIYDTLEKCQEYAHLFQNDGVPETTGNTNGISTEYCIDEKKDKLCIRRSDMNDVDKRFCEKEEATKKLPSCQSVTSESKDKMLSAEIMISVFVVQSCKKKKIITPVSEKGCAYLGSQCKRYDQKIFEQLFKNNRYSGTKYIKDTTNAEYIELSETECIKDISQCRLCSDEDAMILKKKKSDPQTITPKPPPAPLTLKPATPAPASKPVTASPAQPSPEEKMIPVFVVKTCRPIEIITAVSEEGCANLGPRCKRYDQKKFEQLFKKNGYSGTKYIRNSNAEYIELSESECIKSITRCRLCSDEDAMILKNGSPNAPGPQQSNNVSKTVSSPVVPEIMVTAFTLLNCKLEKVVTAVSEEGCAALGSMCKRYDQKKYEQLLQKSGYSGTKYIKESPIYTEFSESECIESKSQCRLCSDEDAMIFKKERSGANDPSSVSGPVSPKVTQATPTTSATMTPKPPTSSKPATTTRTAKTISKLPAQPSPEERTNPPATTEDDVEECPIMRGPKKGLCFDPQEAMDLMMKEPVNSALRRTDKLIGFGQIMMKTSFDDIFAFMNEAKKSMSGNKFDVNQFFEAVANAVGTDKCDVIMTKSPIDNKLYLDIAKECIFEWTE